MTETIIRTIDELNATWARYILPYTKAILEADSNGSPCPKATGVLGRYRARQYLITAEHVTAPPTDSDYGALYIYAPEQIEIVGPIHSVPDPHDLSLIEIPPITQPCLQIPNHLALHPHQGEVCLICGFPRRSRAWSIDRARKTVRPMPLSYMGLISSTSETHFHVRLNSKNVKSRGKRVLNIGKLKGMSGAGAFVLRNDRPRLAGIMIEYHADRAQIVCTKSEVALYLAMLTEADGAPFVSARAT